MVTRKQGAILLKPALWVLLAVGLLVSQPANAKDLCIDFGSATVVGTTASIPKKGKCDSFTGFVAGIPGALLNGTLCASSDGSTVLVHLLAGIFGPESLEASLAVPSLSSTNGEDCAAYLGSCSTGESVAVVACSKPPPTIPAATDHFAVGSSITAP
ncbi:hypothetical protein [Candidatus Binatus sp.]|uniref:hypothetical protein n=1 Tax=Candidatus Binatus sp. TaxID=2811406 RepID=UPI003BDA1301